MSAKQVRKYDPMSVAQATSGPEWEAFLPLARHEKIVAFRDPVKGEVQVRYYIDKNRRIK
jgi:hypothetical protein